MKQPSDRWECRERANGRAGIVARSGGRLGDFVNERRGELTHHTHGHLGGAIDIEEIAGGAVTGATNRVVETLGLPSSRQMRRFQRSIDELPRSQR